MDLLKGFVNYLSSQKNNASKATIKNYHADVRQFVRWFEDEFNKPFNPNDVTIQIIDVYTKSNLSPSKKLSPRSFQRHLSSLRKFFQFLKTEGNISKNPLEAVSNSLESAESVSAKKDNWHLNEFRNQLYLYHLSSLTIKNYVVDIKQFLKWLENVTGINNTWKVRDKNIFGKINETSANEYKERLLTVGLSPKTINRKLSSFRKYLAFVQEQRLIKTDLQDLQIENEKLHTRAYQPLQDLRGHAVHQLRHQYDTNTVTPIKYSRFPPLRLLQKTTNAIFFITDSLLVLPLARTIDQIKYVFWKIKGKPVFKEMSNKQSRGQSPSHRIENFKLKIENYRKAMYAPLSISTAYFPLHKKVWHYVRHNRPKWYKKYHSYAIAHYFHFAILITLISAIGFTLYNDFINRGQNKSVLSTLDSGSRILAFKGRLTDSSDNPITSPNTPLRAIIYNDPIATDSALIWQEVIGVNPNKEGVFETTLGTSIPIPPNMFFENASLWLGISIGQTPELTPRQELALVSLAINAQTVRGLPPITSPDSGTTNVILALDSSGNLNIGGSATPVFQATGGQLTLLGKVLLLTTVFGSNSDVAINPDGIGKIDLQKPLQNTSNNNNIPSAIGAVEVDDLFAVLATSSAQSAFTINQDGTGPIISASTSGAAKFTVENDGSIISAKGASWKPTLDAVNALHIASSSGIPFVTFDTLNSNIGLGTVIPQASLDIIGTFRTSGNVTLSKFTSNGGILYATKSGSLAQVIAGTTTQCLMGGETPKFANCQASPYNNITEANGNIGIGTTAPLFKLDIQDSQTASAAAQIFNTNNSTDADGLVIKLGNISTSAVNNNNHFISFETSGIGIVGSVQGNGGKGVTYATSGPADFAEYFKKDENKNIEYGSLMCINDKGFAVPCDNNNIKMIGITSENPSFLGGENLGNRSIAVGLVGQVYTKVSTINGNIKPGDALTYSSIPGVAVKATKPGQIVGKALDVLHSQGETLQGKILVSVNISWYDPGVYLTNTGDLSIVQNIQNQAELSQNTQKAGLDDSFGQAIERIGTFAQIAVANLQVGLLKAEEVTTNSLAVTTDSVTIAGQTLKEYISNVVKDLAISTKSDLVKQFNNKAIISPIAKIDEIRTNLISPLASGPLIIHLSTQNSQLIVENASGSAVATIDSLGNASFSGTLSSQELEVNKDATVGGTLRAKRILAESIEGLETRVSTLAAQYIQNTQKTLNASTSDNQTPGPSDNSDNLISPSVPSLPNNSLTASFASFTHGLMSFGPTSLAETAIAGPLYIESSLVLAGNSINVLGSNLELQSLRQGGISFLAGLMEIDRDGNIKVEGNAEFAKDVSIRGMLAVNIISPIPEHDLIIHLGGGRLERSGVHDSSEVNASGKLIVENASGSAVLSVNQLGDLTASGSGTFSKLNLSLVQEALALSPTEIIATGAAGVAAIKAIQTELTIKNNLVTKTSLIYITPVGTPSAQSPFLMRQLPNDPSLSLPNGSFTVGVQTPSLQDILFNWLIVN